MFVKSRVQQKKVLMDLLHHNMDIRDNNILNNRCMVNQFNNIKLLNPFKKFLSNKRRRKLVDLGHSERIMERLLSMLLLGISSLLKIWADFIGVEEWLWEPMLLTVSFSGQYLFKLNILELSGNMSINKEVIYLTILKIHINFLHQFLLCQIISPTNFNCVLFKLYNLFL